MRSLPILIVALAVLVMPVAAEVPINMSYQGVLRDDVGNVVPDDDYVIDFRIYDAEVAGTLYWSEHLTVSTLDGVFNAVLGEVMAMHIDFDAQYWLALSVAGEAELSPRVKLTAAPYAHRSATANELRAGGSINVTGFRLTSGATSGHVLTSDAAGNGSWQPAAGTIGGGGTANCVPVFTAPATLGDSPLAVSASDVGIGTVFPQTKLTISSMTYDDHLTIDRPGDDTGHISIGAGNLLLWMGSGSALAVNGSGNVGVGVTAPAAKLDVSGTAQMTGFKMPTGASDGHVLVSDASGNGSWQVAAPDDDWQASGSDIYRANGDVGIGTSSPEAKLDVNGTIQTDGFRMPMGAGEGMALQCDSNGDAMWEYPRTIVEQDYIYTTVTIPETYGQIEDAQVTITVPRAGWISITSQVQLDVDHTSGTRDEVLFSHTSDPTDWGCWAEVVRHVVPASWPSESDIDAQIAVISNVPVYSAGTYTYYLCGHMAHGYDGWDHAYGIVTTAIFHPASVNKELTDRESEGGARPPFPPKQ